MRFRIQCAMPAHEKVNAFLRACDLGMEGIFVKKDMIATVTHREDATEEQKAQTGEYLRKSCEASGCLNVIVTPLDDKPEGD